MKEKKKSATEASQKQSFSTRELGTKTASGCHLHDAALTAAHDTFPFGSRVIEAAQHSAAGFFSRIF